jgi:hypothetical protein
MITVQGGHDNWYTLHFDNESASAGNFEMSFESGLARPMSWTDAADYTAQQIAKKYDNLYLALSGGLDSEFVADVLWRNKIKFTPVIVCLPHSADHHYAIKWCRDRGIEPQVFELEFNDRRLYPEAERLINALGFYSNGCVITSWITNWVQQQQGHLITGEPTLGQRYYHRPITEFMDVWWVQLISQLVFPDYDHPAGFMIYTPEIMLSQAMHLDSSIDDVESRAKLYDLPYRAKLNPPLDIITDRILHNIINVGKLRWSGPMTEQGGHGWDRKVLIEKLQNVQ